ncbi:unnamed protein product [Cuscuta epithymum]|uniref:ENTH domain-containing protein n=1 Tax=Cuscuta epithymum TaxID=186058 RepID=A0AAV0ETL5_9ASTE|nr:unnamed protein product [Cuscuta epithymum]CAH9126622.1 unnamed protein product [Cuscuta epithymum]
MDFMKVIDQTVREIKREVNLKVLKVPEIEQKVLDATDDEPWGPHGTAMAEIAQATKKFSECSIVMNVLWTRLTETEKNWRYVYKALVVLEYLVAHGSERAVDEIVEHTYHISSLTKFEYVEPNGKDMGINVRKKAENIVSILNDKDKIQDIRNKASANREKYIGLSSTGITYKSGSAAISSGSRYGGFGSNIDSDSSAHIESGRYGDDKLDKNANYKSRREISGKEESSNNKTSHIRVSATTSKTNKTAYSNKNASKPSLKSSTPSSNYEDDFDDFDPRGTSSAKPTAEGSTSQVDLFGQSLGGDLLETPTSSSDKPAIKNEPTEVDLFAEADFVTALPETGGNFQAPQAGIDLFSQPEAIGSSKSQGGIDLFWQTTPFTSATPTPPSTFDFFGLADPAVQSDTSSKQEPINTNSSILDPFANVPVNAFSSSNPFDSFVSQTDPASATSGESSGNLSASLVDSKCPSKKDAFQVKSGIWADSLSRGLIDLNISAPKKGNLADSGCVGGLTGGSEKEKELALPTFYMGQGTGIGKSGFSSGDNFFSAQFGSFQK